MAEYFSDKFGNPSSIHQFGQEARAALDGSRDNIATLLGAKGSELCFVSGGTESGNLALKGAAWEMLKSRPRLHIITSAAEHHAVLESCDDLRERGCEVTFLGVDGTGMVDPDDVRRAVRPETAMISIMHVNNEVGTINPIAQIGAIAREKGILFHSDVVQSFGKLALDVNAVPLDLASLSAHKIYGPKGIGGLYIRKGVGTARLLHGGGQERGRRAGTENVALAAGFAKAASLMAADRDQELDRLARMKDRFRSMLGERFPFILFNGHPVSALPHIVTISFDANRIEIDGDALLFNLDLMGIAVTSGSACTSGSMEPSHVLLAMGRDPRTARATIRFSMGRSTTADDLEYAVGALDAVVRRIGKVK